MTPRRRSRVSAGAPARRCVGCGRSLPKGELLRLVRDADGRVRPDPDARADGRGAYVCANAECAASLDRVRPLARSFRAPVELTHETLDFITEWQRSASTK
jgi:uncharacterized protein